MTEAATERLVSMTVGVVDEWGCLSPLPVLLQYGDSTST